MNKITEKSKQSKRELSEALMLLAAYPLFDLTPVQLETIVNLAMHHVPPDVFWNTIFEVHSEKAAFAKKKLEEIKGG